MTDQVPGHWQRTRDDWITILRSRGIRPARSMGQNFLVEPDIADAIVDASGVGAGETALEIGPGLGMLTRSLAETGASVVAVELDRELKAFLDRDLAAIPNVSVIEGDALKVDIASLVQGDYRVVANLPYSTGTHIVRRFLESTHAPQTMTVMLQREVAERLVAEPPGMSLLTLARVIHAEAKVVLNVPPDAFWPEPNVESTVIHLRLRDVPLLNPGQVDAVFRLATMAFQRKRKTIGNGLSQGLGQPKAEIEAVLDRVGINPSLRPQNLEVHDWLAIAEGLAE